MTQIVWLRRDLRLDDHVPLTAALAGGGAVVFVFIRDGAIDALGAAPKFRLGLSLAALQADLEARGQRLILRSGEPLAVLRELAGQVQARGVHWQRRYDVDGMEVDQAVKAGLKADGLTATSHAGFTLLEPFELATGAGTPFRVFTPFWRALQMRQIAAPLPPPGRIPAPTLWPASENLTDWHLGRSMNRGADIVAPFQCVGADAAMDRLLEFRENLTRYTNRDALDQQVTSNLSENLALGEISPRRIWAALGGLAGAEAYLRQLAWRDFAWHLAFHTPALLTGNWRAEWDAFPWVGDGPQAEAWRRGQTGEPIVDAAMREMFVTGRMHNRARMIVASYLTKHLLTDWRIGRDWFEDCLTDWDAANNAMGWQWVAGSGPDAAPYFRIYNPETQAEKFDPAGAYRRRWLGDDSGYRDAVPRAWGDVTPPARPITSLSEGRARALAAYDAFRSARDTLSGPGEV